MHVGEQLGKLDGGVVFEVGADELRVNGQIGLREADGGGGGRQAGCGGERYPGEVIHIGAGLAVDDEFAGFHAGAVVVQRGGHRGDGREQDVVLLKKVATTVL